MSEKLKVVDFPVSPLSDVPKKLRDLADVIEGGTFGEWKECIVVLHCDQGLEVFGLGAEADGTGAHYLLACAQRKIENPMLEY